MGFVLQNIEFVKIATDVSLIIALLYLGARMYRSPRATAMVQRVGQLEGSLRNLVKEAEGASRNLNDQLLKRQQSLEKLLFDLETIEQRVNSSISRVDEKKIAIDSQIATAKRVLDQFATEMSKKEVSDAARAPQLSHPAFEGRIVEAAPVPEPQSFGRRAAQLAARKVQTNIYGEPLEAAPQTATAMAPPPAARKATQRYMQTLAKKVEREVSPESAVEPDLSASIEEVYAAAEKLIRAGKEFDFVARATNLPLEEVEALARLSRPEEPRDQEPEVVGEEDPRLGVLSGIRRQVQVL